MKTVDREYVENNRREILEAIKAGKIFIYPTDTIYGLGCNALLESSVTKIREIKSRDTKPFLLIAPSKSWILENAKVEKEIVDQYFPGPYTIIANRIQTKFAPNVNFTDEIGLRIPDHWFTKLVEEAGVPFVTTSVNITGDKHMERLEDVSEEILSQVDFVVYEGEKRGESSTKINLV